MPKVEIDYSNTIIYKITCKDPSVTDVYVGHTTNFVQRKHAHKQSCNNDNCKLYKVIRDNGGWQNWKMEIVNFFNCHDHYEARKKEQEYFVLLNATLNSIEPMPKPKDEYNDDQPTIKPVCETCNKIFDNEQLYAAHVNTNNHKKRLDNTYSQPNFIISKFECKICHFKCDKQSNWNKHLLTPKHKRQIFLDKLEQNASSKYICKYCEKVYKARNSLWYHENKCEIQYENKLVYSDNKLLHLILDVVKSNTELQKQNQDFQKQMLETYKNCIDNKLTS